MTTSDHKPSFTQDGLWTVGERYHDQYGRETIDIETETNCLLVARAVGAKEIEANAHLISAAPDMYEVLQALLLWADSQCPCRDELPNPCPLCGARADAPDACKSVEAIFPRVLLTTLQNSLSKARGES